MTTRRLLTTYGVIALAISLPFTIIHLIARPDDAPITPLQHVTAAAANFFGPWGVVIVRLVDFPNAGLRSFSWTIAIDLTLGRRRARRPGSTDDQPALAICAGRTLGHLLDGMVWRGADADRVRVAVMGMKTNAWILTYLLIACPVLRGETVDLLTRYPTKLTTGDAAPDRARAWEFTLTDVFRLSRFRFTVDQDLQIEIGPADLGIGHCADGAVWAVVIPRDSGTLNGKAAKQEESVSYVWLRFHPKEVSRLFPPETVFTDGAKNLVAQMRP